MDGMTTEQGDQVLAHLTSIEMGQQGVILATHWLFYGVCVCIALLACIAVRRWK